MTGVLPVLRRAAGLVLAALCVLPSQDGVRAAAPAEAAPTGRLVTAADAIRAALAERMGAGADIVVRTIDLAADAPLFREARPDPSAWLGKPIRFTLVTASGAAVGVTASVGVVADHVVTTGAVSRGTRVGGDAVVAVRADLVGVPLKRLPVYADVVGARALRPLLPGAIVLSGAVAVRRAVEPGDEVTVTAAAGAIEITAVMVAADGGNVGATIRVRHPETRRFLRGRIVRPGEVEVIHER
jgi:flagella basal body P-ring formation protein FlgA